MLITKNFSKNEMACACCQKADMDEEFMRMLQELRDVAGFPFRINSGFRCLKHNAAVSSRKTKAGIHTFGKACDISVMSLHTTQCLKLIQQAQDIGFQGLGINFRGDRKGRFLHVDSRGTEDNNFPPAAWTY